MKTFKELKGKTKKWLISHVLKYCSTSTIMVPVGTIYGGVYMCA